MKYFTAFVAGFVLGTLLFKWIGHQELKREAISLGHAQYNPTNANFEWKAVKS